MRWWNQRVPLQVKKYTDYIILTDNDKQVTEVTGIYNLDTCTVLLLFHVVDVVLFDTVNKFKSYLDKYWQYQDIVYDYKANIHGTISRSSHY